MRILLSLTFVVIWCLQCFSQSDAAQTAMDAVWEIPEVITLNENSHERNDSSRLEVIIYQISEDKEPNYYWIKVGTSTETHFSTVFNFFVFFNTNEVKYYDTLLDQVLSLDEWRAQKNK